MKKRALSIFTRFGLFVTLAGLLPGDFQACRWRHGVMTDLATLGGTFSDSTGINNHRQIVGTSTVASGQQHTYTRPAHNLLRG